MTAIPAVEYLSVLQDGDGSRTIRSRFRWGATNLANLKACTSVTYEHEFWEYNYSRKHYLGSLKSWSSNMPGAYKDTSFGDSKDELGYTIGSSRGAELKSGTGYATTIRANKGNASSGKGKLQGQRGRRVPPSCFSTWCVFPKATGVVYTAWTVKLPGTK